MVLLKHILLFRRVRIKARSESSPRNDLKDKTNDGDKMWTLLCRVSGTIFDKRSQHACALTESVGDRVFILMDLLSSCFLVIAGRSYCSVESLTQRRTSTWASWLWPNFPRAQRPGYIGKAAYASPAVNTQMFRAAFFVCYSNSWGCSDQHVWILRLHFIFNSFLTVALFVLNTVGWTGNILAPGAEGSCIQTLSM